MRSWEAEDTQENRVSLKATVRETEDEFHQRNCKIMHSENKILLL